MDRNRPAVRWLGRGLLLAPLLFLLVFYIYPLGVILEYSFARTGQLDLSGFERLITRPYYRETLWFTLKQAVLSTLLTLALAIPGAQVFARYHFPGKSLLLALATIPFVLPTVVVAAAFTALIGRNGLLNELLMQWLDLTRAPIRLERSLTLILIAHVFYNYAVALRLISSFWANQNRRMQEAARVLGASPLTVFWRITLPMIFPAIAAAGALVFTFTFTSFGVVLILGGVQYATLEVEIYRQSTALFNLETAGALAVVQLFATLLMMILYTAIQRRVSQPQVLQASRQVARPPRYWREWLWVGLNLLVLVSLIFTPLLALVERSFAAGDRLRYYDALSENPRRSVIAVPPTEAIQNSLRIAAYTTLFAVILGTLAAYLLMQPRSRWLDPLFMLPLATSAVTLGFGFLLALGQFRRESWLIPVAHTLVAMPFVVRSLLPALRSIRPSIREAAGVLGASAWVRWWRIDLPLIARSVVVGATFAFTISMGEFGAAVFIARPQQPTIPIVIFRFLGQPGNLNYGQAMAMSVILMAVCAVGFLLIERLNRAVIGEF